MIESCEAQPKSLKFLGNRLVCIRQKFFRFWIAYSHTSTLLHTLLGSTRVESGANESQMDFFFIGGRHWRTCAWLCRNTQFSFQIIFCSYFNFSLVVLLIKHTAVTLKCEFASNEEKKNENKKRTFNGIVPSECVSLSLSIYSIRSSDRWCNKTLCVRLCVSMRCAYGNFTQMKNFRLHNFIEVRLRQRLRRFLVWIWPYIVRIGERVAHGVTLNRSPKCCKVHIEHSVCIFSAFFGLVFFSEGVSHCVYRLQQ